MKKADSNTLHLRVASADAARLPHRCDLSVSKSDELSQCSQACYDAAAGVSFRVQGRKFVAGLSARRVRRYRAATTIQGHIRGAAGRRVAACYREERWLHQAATRLQLAARAWLMRRLRRRRSVLRRLGACAACCFRKPEIYYEGTQQV